MIYDFLYENLNFLYELENLDFIKISDFLYEKS